MKLWRNRELRAAAIFYAALTAVSAICGFLIAPAAGILAVLICAATFAVSLINTTKRYHEMERFAGEIDEILHNSKTSSLSDYSEGELSILKTEVVKLLLRLREQSALLGQERNRLADSMADISHQLRTPLTSINLILTMLAEDELDAESRTVKIAELKRQVSRIDWLVSSLLKLAKLDAGTVPLRNESVLLSDMLGRALSPLMIPMELGEITLRLDVSGSFCGDCDWTAEAVGNIAKNCVEHMRGGGELIVRARENTLYSEVYIADSGEGIDPSELPHLFERFYKGKNSSESSVGIGLALARTIIVSQNGTVKAENRREGGAAFTVRFYKSVI